jgi:hypothetical protein
VYELELAKDRRHSPFLSAYDLDLRMRNVHVKLGRFSFGLLNTIKLMPHRDDQTVFDAGCFCESSVNAKVLVGGNHRNDDLFNHTFASGKLFLKLMDDDSRRLSEVAPSKPIVIGHNVVLSDGVTVTSGSQIGSGAVIAAGAVVSGNLEPLGIYGGVPARLIRSRFEPDRADLYHQIDFSNVAAHCLDRLPSAVMKLQTGEISVADFRRNFTFLARRPVIEMTMEMRAGSDRGIQLGTIIGYRIGDDPISDETIIQKLNNYFAQMNSDEPIVKWTPDIFDTLDLYTPD